MTSPASQNDAPPAADLHKSPLRAHLSTRFALSWPHVLVSGFFAALFLAANYVPLFHSDLWGHVSYGAWILDEGRLPTEDPFVPLAAGIRIVDTAWLGQITFAGIERAGDAAWLSNAFAIIVTLTYAVLFVAFLLQTRRIGVALTATLIVLALAFSRILVMRTEILASLCCAALILIIVRLRSNEEEASADSNSWPTYLLLPIVMAIWANVHGSFPVGLVIVWCHFLGRVVEAVSRTRHPGRVISDRLVRRWLIRCELATVAVLLNPYGIDLALHAVTFAGNANLSDVQEWSPLQPMTAEGFGLLISWGLLLVLFRKSRAPVRPADVLLIGIFTVAVWFRIRMSVWYAYVFGMVVAPHIADLVARKWPAFSSDRPPELDKSVFGRTYIHTLACGLLLWMGLALSPIFTAVAGGSPRSPEQLHDQRTPLGATAFLRQHPPAGPVFNPQWWGDWLVWDGPLNLKPFVTTNATHVVPNQVWRDYRRILAADRGWLRILQTYRVETVVVHKDDQTRLDQQIRLLSSGWQVVYEDNLALIVSRDSQLLAALQRSTESQKRKNTPR